MAICVGASVRPTGVACLTSLTWPFRYMELERLRVHYRCGYRVDRDHRADELNRNVPPHRLLCGLRHIHSDLDRPVELRAETGDAEVLAISVLHQALGTLPTREGCDSIDASTMHPALRVPCAILNTPSTPHRIPIPSRFSLIGQLPVRKYLVYDVAYRALLTAVFMSNCPTQAFPRHEHRTRSVNTQNPLHSVRFFEEQSGLLLMERAVTSQPMADASSGVLVGQ